MAPLSGPDSVSRRMVATVVCLGLVIGGGAVLATGGSLGDQVPAWNEVSPSLQLDESSTETMVHESINDARGERDLDRLQADDGLREVARGHSRDMADRGYFAHTSPDGVEPAMRVEQAGIACDDVGENIVKLPRGNHEEPLTEDAVDAWLNSPGHLMNIVDADWTRTGVGVHATDNSVYITQVFCAD